MYFEEAVKSGDTQLARTPYSFDDYQMQLMLLEQQKKKRDLCAKLATDAADAGDTQLARTYDYSMQLLLLEQQKKKRDLYAKFATDAADAAIPSSSASRKRSLHAVSDGSITREVDVAIDSVPDIQPPRLSTGEDQEQYNIRCICGYDTDDGNTVCCDTCNTWQHTECYYTDKDGNVPTKEELAVLDHFCADCRPRLLDAKGAAERQRIRQQGLGDRKVTKATAKRHKEEDPKAGIH